MRFALQLVSWGIGLPLSLMVIAALLRGGYRIFPVLFIYEIVDFLLTVAGMPPYIDYYFISQSPQAKVLMAKWYWVDELVLQPLVYAVVISLLIRATEKMPSRRPIRMGLIGASVLIAAASYLYHHNYHYIPNMAHGEWMAFWTRDLSFSTAILDVALWGLLLASRIKDARVLLISGGLGIQFAGEAIAESLRSMAVNSHSKPLALTGNLLMPIVDLTAIYIIWQAVRVQKPKVKTAAP